LPSSPRALKDAAITARRVYDRCPSTIIDGVLILLAIVAGFAFAVHVVADSTHSTPGPLFLGGRRRSVPVRVGATKMRLGLPAQAAFY
jgi:hypothetical protein